MNWIVLYNISKSFGFGKCREIPEKWWRSVNFPNITVLVILIFRNCFIEIDKFWET